MAEGLDKRERHIADQIFQANEANQKAKDLLAGLRKEAGRFAGRSARDPGKGPARRRAGRPHDARKGQGRRQGRRRADAKQIDAATASAIKELADRSAALAVELAGKIVHAKLNPKDHAKLIEQAVAGFAENKERKVRE